MAELNLLAENVARVLCDENPGVDGWAIVTSIDGDPSFAAFFVREEDAREAVVQKDADGFDSYFDASVELAVLTPRGVMISNNVFHKTHDELRLSIVKEDVDV